MIFQKTHDLMLKRLKWHTRRPVKPGEKLCWVSKKGKFATPIATDSTYQPSDAVLAVVKFYPPGYWRIKWQIGKDYAIQPGRGQKSLGRTPLVEEIRRERLQEITMEDAFAEGVHSSEGVWAVNRFEELWDRIYRKAAYRYQGFRWRDNPEVWVLEFEKEE